MSDDELEIPTRTTKRISEVGAGNRRRRSRGEVLDTLATLFGTYVGVGGGVGGRRKGGNGNSDFDGGDTTSTATSVSASGAAHRSPRSPQKQQLNRNSSSARSETTTSTANDDYDDNYNDNNDENDDNDYTGSNNHSPQHRRQRQRKHKINKEREEDEDRYEGEELAVAAAVRVNKENIRLRALVETTAERMQAALESLKEKDAMQQQALTTHTEKANAVQQELFTTQHNLDTSRAEVESLRIELERAKTAIFNESQKSEAVQAEHRKQEREMGELKAQKNLLTQRVERLAVEAEAKVTEVASLTVSAQSQQSTRNELALLQTRCNELLEQVASLTADKDRLSLLLKKGRALSDQHFLGGGALGSVYGNGGASAVNEDVNDFAVNNASNSAVQWKDAPNWVPVGIVQASSAFIKRYPMVHERDMKDFLIACNSVWHSRLQAIADNVEKSATKRTKMLHTPYREVLQASTISRLRATISNLQALLQAQNPASVRFTSASVDLPRLTPGETLLLRGGGHGADVVQARANVAYTTRPRSASRTSHVPTEARLLSVPGSGGKRLDAEESRKLFDEAMQCIDYLARRLEVEEGRGSGFPNPNMASMKDNAIDDDVITDAERLRLGNAGAEYARRIESGGEGGGGGGMSVGSHDRRNLNPPSSSSSSSYSSHMSSSLHQGLPDVATAAPRTLRFDENLQTQHTTSTQRGGGGGGGGGRSVMDALTAAASPPRFSTNAAYKRSIESW
jgi:hypothetical protein